MRPPFPQRIKFSTPWDSRRSQLRSSIAPTSPHPPNRMCLKVQRNCGNSKASAIQYPSSLLFFLFFLLRSSSPPRRHRAERRPFPTFPGRHCSPSSVILLHGRFFYPFSWRSHGVASETSRIPAKARVLAAAQNRSPIYVRYMTTPGEHIVSVRLFPYRASPAISTRNPYPVS